MGQVFKTMSKHVPPSPLVTSPLLWGVEETVRERFGNAVSYQVAFITFHPRKSTGMEIHYSNPVF